jgi:hypothetical protein
MLNAAAELKIAPSRDPKVKVIESERSSLDSYHDNTSSRQHPIINNLYNGKTSYTDEGKFVDYIEKQAIPDEYYLNRNLRLEKRLKGFFTTRMECLVNKTPLHFKNSPNTTLTFVYDQGPHPVNYFEKAVNGMFISDAVDTAPKLTDRSQRPVLFRTPKDEIVVPGSYIGFNENVVRTIIFSDFSSVSDKVQCKVIIEARLNDQSPYRWFDLSQKFDLTNNKLIGYTLPKDARANANFKRSNDKNTGFFIGNANSKRLLENPNLKPIIALCLVVAKLLGDFSSALASSPRNIARYTVAEKTYGKSEQIDIPEMIIHASGDRLCSLEASRQGANSIKTSPRNSDGIIPIQYTPGVNANQPIDYKQRFNTIKAEIIQRFDDLLVDLNAFSIYKYKVDGRVVPPQNRDQLENYVKTNDDSLTNKIKRAKMTIERYITLLETNQTKFKEYNKKYEILYRQKIEIMPQSPLISTSTKQGYRKNLNSKFHVFKFSNDSRLFIDLRAEVNRIFNLKPKTGGKRKLRRRTLRRSRGGQKPTKERALADFDYLRYFIQEKMLNFASSRNVIDYDSTTNNSIIIERFNRISGSRNEITANEFINAVKENKHEVTDPKEIEWAKEFAVKDEEPPTKILKLDEKIYVPDYDEEFMEELEQSIKENYETETIDPEVIALMESITFDEPPTDATMSDSEPPKPDNTMTDDEISASSLTNNETSTPANKEEKVPLTPSSRASTPNSEPKTLPVNRSEPSSDIEFSQGGRKRKTYRRVRLF